MSKQKGLLGYYFFRLLLAFFYILPFWCVYGISNFLYLLLYYGGYRKKVVYQNLEHSFPNKSEKERQKIAKRFYRHLADIFVEGIKGMTLSDQQAIKRWKILTPETANGAFTQQQSSIFVGAHYNNWEWGALATGLQVDPPVIVFYKPIRNKRIDRFVRTRRMHKGVLFAPVDKTATTFQEEGHKYPMYNMIADQSPSNPQKSHWIRFLNQETGVLHGPAKYAQEQQLPIWFIYINKVKRGFYEISAELLVEDPNTLTALEISTLFMKRVEEQIVKQPEFWLWSHKRWKHKRPIRQDN